MIWKSFIIGLARLKYKDQFLAEIIKELGRIKVGIQV
jgi:hypothetical protein